MGKRDPRIDAYIAKQRDFAKPIWDLLIGTGKVTPAGLGARDTLRLEMGMALYGNDIDDKVTPLDANLGWLTKINKGDFVGKDVLVKQKADGLKHRLVFFTVDDGRSIARHGYPVFYDGKPSGTVCSGTMSPSLNTPIGTAYVPFAGAKEGSKLEFEVRGKRATATVVKPPFYKNASHK